MFEVSQNLSVQKFLGFEFAFDLGGVYERVELFPQCIISGHLLIQDWVCRDGANGGEIQPFMTVRFNQG